MRPSDGPDGLAVHASAVAIGGRALLIFGRSKSGKSRLAFALTRASSAGRAIEFIGDDRVLLWRAQKGAGASIEVRPHPRIAGFIERRGLGLVALDHRDRAIVAASVRLGDEGATPLDGVPQNLPTMRFVSHRGDMRDAGAVLDWWDHAVARPSHHTSSRKRTVEPRTAAKDWNW